MNFQPVGLIKLPQTMKFKLLYKNFIILLTADLLLLTGALYVAHLIRFDFNVPSHFLGAFYRMLPYVLITKIACFFILICIGGCGATPVLRI
jgi:hypothetical protein